MILNLLEREGIQGRIDGEYLPGGVGELQPIDLVRVMVEDADYEAARQVIKDWEAVEVEREEPPPRKVTYGIPAFALGLVIGSGLVAWAYNSPVTKDGVDRDGDGVLDEKWTYRDGRMTKAETDRNFDGKVDLIYHYDLRGLPKRAKYDDDFDGIYETEYIHEDAITQRQESDLNQDGDIDYRVLLRHGNIDEAVILGAENDYRKKRQRFHMGKLISAQFDTDGDGSFDIEYEYDHFEEIKRAHRLPSVE